MASEWEVFGSDSEEEEEAQSGLDGGLQSTGASAVPAAATAAFVAVVAAVGTPREVTLTLETGETQEFLAPTVGVIGGPAAASGALEALQQRLLEAKFSVLTDLCATAAAGTEEEFQVDALVDLGDSLDLQSAPSRPRGDRSKAWASVRPGGLLCVLAAAVEGTELFDPRSYEASVHLSANFSTDEWRLEDAALQQISGPVSGLHLLILQRRAAICNPQAAVWKDASRRLLLEERRHIESVSVSLTMQERRLRGMSDAAQAEATVALERHGFVIIRGLADPIRVHERASLALQDLDQAITTLKREKEIDLLHPDAATTSELGQNFFELAMREAFRVDLRHGPRMKKAAATDGRVMMRHAGPRDGENVAHQSKRPKPWRPDHPAVMSVLQRLMYPMPTDESICEGNYGRWNFDGGGPHQPIQLRVGPVGAVVSLPGAGDQAIHADIYHLFEHAHLPPHYVNLFMPCIPRPERDFSVGQTAFVLGSHRMETCSQLVQGTPRSLAERERRLVRPHLDSGDIVLFDCRILHFGLANRSTSTWRPLLYANITQPWFEDKKNWEKTRLFSEEEEEEGEEAATAGEWE